MALEFLNNTITVNKNFKMKHQYTNVSKHKIPIGSILEPGTKFSVKQSINCIMTERSGCAIYNCDGNTCTIIVDTSCSVKPGEYGELYYESADGYFEGFQLYAIDQNDNSVIFCVIHGIGSASGGSAPLGYIYKADTLVYSLTFNDTAVFSNAVVVNSNLIIKGGIHHVSSN